MIGWPGTLVRRALPQRCELCGAASDAALLCAACMRALPRLGAACPRCALPSSDGALCGRCIASPPPQAATIAAFAYAFPVDRLLQRLKYGGHLALAEWAGSALAAAVGPTLAARVARERPEAAVALPLSPTRQRGRGFNQAREIAAWCVRSLPLPLAFPLERAEGGVPQAELSWARRLRNVEHAFAVRDDLRGMRLALIDDVMTTGATLAAASRALLGAGAARVECWAVARTLPPGPLRP